MRPPTAEELLFADLGISSGDSRFCAKIASGAYLAAAWTTRGYQISSVRSECFYHVAQKTGQAYFCDEVRSMRKLWLDGGKISREVCMRALQEGPKVPGPGRPSPPHHEIVRLLRQLGYDESTMPVQVKQYFDSSDPRFAFFQYYSQLKTSRVFLDSALGLPDGPQ